MLYITKSNNIMKSNHSRYSTIICESDIKLLTANSSTQNGFRDKENTGRCE